MKKILIQSCLAVIIFSLTAFAQKPAGNDIADVLDEYLTRMAGFGFSGAVIVEKEGKFILRKGYGYSNREKHILFTPDTPYPVQSIAKQFTAASILKLEEQGKLSLNDPIEKYFKDVPDDKRSITIHQLLTHTSGFTADYSGANIFDQDKAVKAILKNPLGNPIGKVMSYNNDGYELLAAIVRIVSGQDLADFIRRDLFLPAGMKTAGFQGDGDLWEDGAVAHGYNSYVDNGSPQYTKPDWDGRGSTDIIASANDLFKWELSLRNEDVLSAGIKEKMFTPYVDFIPDWQYGYGWFVIRSKRGTTEYYHGGGDTPGGYTASYTRYPAEKMTIIIFTNTMIDELGFLRAVKDDITDIAFGKSIQMPPAFTDPENAKLQKFTGIYKAGSGEEFVVKLLDGQLMIGALNQPSIDLLTTPDKDTKAKIKEYSNLTSQYLRKIANDKTGELLLRSDLKDLKRRYGNLINHKLLGTYPVSEDRGLLTTYAKLNFEKGDEVVRFVRSRDNDPYPLLGNPYPAFTPIKPQKGNGFVAYYPFLKKSVEIKFDLDSSQNAVSINVKNSVRTLSATKVRHN
ncbi:MAG: beta-lactamase family protein [Acidobacteria bacterium]|nr:beta-lactamase family protein [Acidobacteriota bacterium]